VRVGVGVHVGSRRTGSGVIVGGSVGAKKTGARGGCVASGDTSGGIAVGSSVGVGLGSSVGVGMSVAEGTGLGVRTAVGRGVSVGGTTMPTGGGSSGSWTGGARFAAPMNVTARYIAVTPHAKLTAQMGCVRNHATGGQ